MHNLLQYGTLFLSSGRVVDQTFVNICATNRNTFHNDIWRKTRNSQYNQHANILKYLLHPQNKPQYQHLHSLFRVEEKHKILLDKK